MGTQQRRDRERLDTRGKILDAAREMFATRGVEATTMRAIANRIEYTPTAIYYHFRDKEDLIRELCHTDFQSLARAFNRIGRIEEPIERLKRIGLAYVDFAADHPHHYQIMFMTVSPHVSKHPEVRGNPEEDAYAFLRATVVEGMAAGRYREEFTDPDHLAQLFWASVHGIVSLRIAKKHDPWVEWTDLGQSARDMVEILVRGVERSRE